MENRETSSSDYSNTLDTSKAAPETAHETPAEKTPEAPAAAPAAVSTKKKIINVLILAVLIAALVLLIRACGSNDKSLGVKDLMFNDISTEKTMGELLSAKPFCDLKWSNQGNTLVYATVGDENGNVFVISFERSSNGTVASTGSVTMNGEDLDEWRQLAFFSYVATGDYEYFTECLTSLGVLEDYYYGGDSN